MTNLCPVSSAILVLLAALPARSDAAPALDLAQGSVFSSGRITGLGGAFAGVAEGQDGEAFNPAALAQRHRRLDRSWDWDFVFSFLGPTGKDLSEQDFDNDGRVDAGLSSRSSLQLGLSFQAKRLGFGMLLRGFGLSSDVPEGRLQFATQDFALGVAWAMPQEVLVFGLELAGGYGSVGLSPALGSGDRVVYYAGARLRPGMLWRPASQRFRFGVLLDPGQLARPTGDETVLGFAAPPGLRFPAALRFGLSTWLGPNAAHYNAPCPQAIRDSKDLRPTQKVELLASRPRFEQGVPTPVMLSAELVLVGATKGAVAPAAWLARPEGELAPSGTEPSLAVHAGAEWEPLRWLILRAGGYLEPSRVGAGPRPHGTFGAEVKVPFWPLDLRLALAGDLAARFRNMAFSVGLWDSVAPSEAPAPRPARPGGG